MSLFQLPNVSLPWYALQVRPRYEQAVATALAGKAHESYAPQQLMERRWKDRAKRIAVPLFPGYVFCRLDVERRLGVLTTPGVLGLVGVGKVPVPIEQHEMENVQAVTARLAAEAWTGPVVGDAVKVIAGPLRGVTGTLVETKGTCRLIVSIHLLQQAIAVEFDRAHVRRGDGNRRAYVA